MARSFPSLEPVLRAIAVIDLEGFGWRDTVRSSMAPTYRLSALEVA